MPVVVSRHEFGAPGIVWGTWQSFYEPPGWYKQLPVTDEYHYWWKVWRPQHISIEFEAATRMSAEFMWREKRPWWLNF